MYRNAEMDKSQTEIQNRKYQQPQICEMIIESNNERKRAKGIFRGVKKVVKARLKPQMFKN